MNKQKLATVACIVVSVLFTVVFGLYIHFIAFQPLVQEVYEKTIDYPEDLYKEYIKEAEEMIARQEYTSQYPMEANFYLKNNRTTLILKIGEYDEGDRYSDYVIVTVENYGTKEQETIIERSRRSAEEAYEDAVKYKEEMNIFTIVFVVILVLFTVYLVKFSLKRCYIAVFAPILAIAVITIFVRAMFYIKQ